MLRFASSFSDTLGNIPSKERKKNPDSSALTLVSYQRHNARTANRNFCGSGG